MVASQSSYKRLSWRSKASELRWYGIPHGRFWRVYERIENPKAQLTMRERAEEVKQALSVEEVFTAFAVKARKGSSYYTIECPNPEHEDKNPSCVVWPSIKSFKCYSCGSSGDIIELVRLLEESKEASA